MPGRSFSSPSYRYGFNGQEKDDEVSGSGNSMTAEFWEYDSRLGRRWNIDPVTKSWETSYHGFSNQPVWKIDPLGDDDYFNSEGQFLKSEGSGTKIYVQTDNGVKLLTQIDLSASKSNQQAVANVVGFYAKQVGIKTVADGGIGTIGIKGNPEGDKSEANPAFTLGNDIYVNKKDNKLSSKLDDFNNLKSILIHEKFHKDRGHGFKKIGYFTHAEVYLSAIQDKSFVATTSGFKLSQITAFASALRDSYIKDQREFKDIQNAVDAANKIIRAYGYSISIPDFLPGQAQNFDLIVNTKEGSFKAGDVKADVNK